MDQAVPGRCARNPSPRNDSTMLPIYDLTQNEVPAGLLTRLTALRNAADADGKWSSIAAELIADVRERGDAAVVDQMQRFTDDTFSVGRMRVSADELAAAGAALSGELRGAIERAIENVTAYQRHIRPSDAVPVSIAGAELGLRWTPISPVGLLVPGGSAVLFSSLIMLAVPAIVAGVDPKDITVVSPPPYRKEGEAGAGEAAGDISPITLGVAHLLGIEKVYRVGGPVAVAALAYGTETIRPVNFIAGPGHPVVQAAKLRVNGVVGIDAFYGASEIVTVADSSCDVPSVAADLIAQAEHDPGKCFLIAWERAVIDAILAEVDRQLPDRDRREAIEVSFRDASCALLVKDAEDAARWSDRFAAEHVNLAVADPKGFMSTVQHGGEFFLGNTPVASGDYYAGPSHTLPTDTTGRFASGVSCITFMKRSGTVAYPGGLPAQAIADIAAMAQAEGLDGHAASVQQRAR
ncbi:MAG: histidinol dehydrogenase [Phycisphaerales bacterium JB063]